LFSKGVAPLEWYYVHEFLEIPTLESPSQRCGDSLKLENNLILSSQDMPAAAKAPRWSKKDSKEVIKQFNLFTESGGEEGWDPQNCNTEYIKVKVKDSDVLRPFLAGKFGGFHLHKDCAKILCGYKRASSEYFVKLAKTRVSRST
jgi:hypothetical protein